VRAPAPPTRTLASTGGRGDAGSVRAGGLDGELVEAVLAAAGHAPRRRIELLRCLTSREVEVLRPVAAGLSTRAIADRLVITPKTADSHIQHIYSKIGVSTRAAATMFAMQHDLVS
jgi:DNA-binding NarL/FixJ family response regulator